MAQIPLFPGVTALIESSVRRGPATIASGGRRRDIQAVLERHGLLSHFPSFVSGDDVERSKPDPQCFLDALELLRSGPAPGLPARNCLVFEDSSRGVEAARRAGMMCVAVTNSYPRDELGRAHLVIDSLEEWTWELR